MEAFLFWEGGGEKKLDEADRRKWEAAELSDIGIPR
jgi:hypothetical protein